MVEDNAVSDVEARWKVDQLADGRWFLTAGEALHCYTWVEAAQMMNALQAQADLAAGLRAAAELADELVKALRDCCTQVERFAKSSGMNARVNAYDTLYARYDALNPQPHQDKFKEGYDVWLDGKGGTGVHPQPHHEETK